MNYYQIDIKDKDGDLLHSVFRATIDDENIFEFLEKTGLNDLPEDYLMDYKIVSAEERYRLMCECDGVDKTLSSFNMK